MEPHFGKIDLKMYYDYLSKAKIYFEFGSGGSTYQSCKQLNITKVYSVESDISWYNKVKKTIKSDKLEFMLVDLKCQPNNWGNPGKDCSVETKKKYSNTICDLGKEQCESIDLILMVTCISFLNYFFAISNNLSKRIL
jgi:hypothetical protein